MSVSSRVGYLNDSVEGMQGKELEILYSAQRTIIFDKIALFEI